MRLKDHKTVLEVAKQLGMHPNTIQIAVRAGKLQGLKVGRTWFFTDAQVAAFVQKKFRFLCVFVSLFAGGVYAAVVWALAHKSVIDLSVLPIVAAVSGVLGLGLWIASLLEAK